MRHDLPDLVGVPEDPFDGAVGPLTIPWELLPFSFVITPRGDVTLLDLWLSQSLED